MVDGFNSKPQICLDFTILFINCIGHILLAECTMATLMAARYEHYNKLYFSAVWFACIAGFCLASACEQVLQSPDPSAALHFTIDILAMVYVSVALSFIELIAFSLLGAHNAKVYNYRLKHSTGAHNLSERYQLAENISTGRQLAPTFLFHFGNILFSAIPPVLEYYQLTRDPILFTLVTLAYYLFLSFSNMAIEYTLLSRHPILRKNALKVLSGIGLLAFLQNRVGHSEAGAGTGTTVMRVKNETERHFEMMNREWK